MPDPANPPPAANPGSVRTRHIYLLVGSLIIVAACVIVVFVVPHPTRVQYAVLSVLLSLGAGAFTYSLPGTLEVSWADWLKATGPFAAMALVVVVMFIVFPYNTIETVTITGQVELNDTTESFEIFRNLHFVIRPPDVEPNCVTGEFTLVAVPLDTSQSAPTLLVLKNGYESAGVGIAVNERITNRRRYLVTREGNKFNITTPIQLTPLPTDTSGGEYSPYSGAVATPEPTGGGI